MATELINMTEPTHTFTTEELAARDAAITAKALQMAAVALGERFPDPKEEDGFSLFDAAISAAVKQGKRAILALQPAPTRWQEVAFVSVSQNQVTFTKPDGTVIATVEVAP
jgi:hypothetical protein